MTVVMHSRTGRGRERGTITLAALVLVVPLLVMALAYLTIATRNTIEQDMRCQLRSAEELAQSGIDRALLELVNDPSFERGSRQLDNGAVTYSVANRWTEGDSRFVRIIATGFTNPRVDELGNLAASPASARRLLVAIARERISDYDVKQAVLLSDPNAQVEITGGDFQIQGQDRNYSDGQAGTDGGRPGIAVTGLPSAIKSQLSVGQWGHIQGFGGSPSIVQRMVGSDQVEKLIAYYHSSASIRFGPEARYVGGNLGDPGNDAFVVTYATGDLTISGQTRGAGMLLVTGDLIVDGEFQFTGIVAVRGRVLMTGSAPEHQKSIIGTLLVGDDLKANVNASSTGSLTIQYSSEATVKAKRRAGRYSIEAIMQGS